MKTDRFTRISHKGKPVYIFDYRGLANDNEKEFIETLDAASEYAMKKPPNQLLLINVEGVYTNSAIVAKFKEIAKRAEPLTKKTAILGITGAKAILLKAVSMFAGLDVKPFSSQDEALEWLVS